ncbi:hypothetical protein [Demequina capsici]|uniref:Leucyl aminopeptidase (Aminopeptidase T) n=1 Tax=Demequina capsici TaxID=3075620 RepID=A0AA96F9G0_9MICO|nr:hypothetical protein [Demequina sp. OYTSA14]WNM24080.1 hypothetical protein RN606_12025 [Demequina sp. OYTSA14]
MTVLTPLPDRTVSRVLDTCLGIAQGEKVVVLTDPGSDPAVVAGIVAGLEDRRAIALVRALPEIPMPGAEPPAPIAADLADAAAGIELTTAFIGSSRARQEACRQGTRYVSMPAVIADTFRLGGPYDVDFDAIATTVLRLARAWEEADTFRITTPAGTDLHGSVRGRKGRALTGVAREPGSYMAPPDIESGTAPVELSSHGTVVIDGDFLFMGPGPVAAPVSLDIRDGALFATEGSEASRLLAMMARVDDPRMVNLAEVSVGLNPQGSVCSVPMETESTKGSAHIAFGNSIAYGGTVDAAAHLDCVMRDATVHLDGVPRIVAGELVEP